MLVALKKGFAVIDASLDTSTTCSAQLHISDLGNLQTARGHHVLWNDLELLQQSQNTFHFFAVQNTGALRRELD